MDSLGGFFSRRRRRASIQHTQGLQQCERSAEEANGLSAGRPSSSLTPLRPLDKLSPVPSNTKLSEDSGRASAFSAVSRTHSPVTLNGQAMSNGQTTRRRHSTLSSKFRKRSILSFGSRIEESEGNNEELASAISDEDGENHDTESHITPAWIRRRMSNKSTSYSRRPSSSYRTDHNFSAPHRHFQASVPEFGSVSGFGHDQPPVVGFQSGAAARAAAAAQNEILANMRNMHLEEPKVKGDSESGIGMEVQIWPTALSDNAIPAVRRDPASVLPPELVLHILSFLDSASILQAELVSRQWHDYAKSGSLWRSLFGHEFRRTPKNPCSSSNHIGVNMSWKSMWKTRKALQQRWRDGYAAAIYLEGHTDSVYCVQFDDQKIITGSRDCTVRVWDAQTYECVKVLGSPSLNRATNAPPLPVDAPEFAPRPVAKIFSPHTIASPTFTTNALSHVGSILCLQYDDFLMVTGSSDGSLIMWDVNRDYVPYRRLRDHTSGVLDVCFDETYIISCSKDATIKVWLRSTGQLLRTLRGHRGPVNAVQLRGNLVVSASGDSMAKLWNLKTGLCLKDFQSKDRGMACVEFSPDSKYILAGGNDQVIYQFDATSGELVRELSGHENLVRSLHLDSNNDRVVSGSYDNSVKAFDLNSGETIVSLSKWTSSWILSAKADYRRIIATSQDSRAVIIDFGFQLPGIEALNFLSDL